MRVIPWQRAVTLFFCGKVEVIEEYDHDIHSVSLAIKAPAVVRLLQYVKMGRRSPPFCRANVIARDNFECQYCGVRLGSRDVTLDHIVPRSLGGQTTWTNVVCSCMRCNTKKGDKSLTKSGMTLKQIPTKPDWLPVLNVRFHGSVPEVWHPFLGF